MLEIIVMLSIVSLFAVCVFSPSCTFSWVSKTENAVGPAVPVTTQSVTEESMFRNPFLGQLQSEIEAALFPRPTDSVLQRHYDAMVAVEVKNRLAELTS